MPRLGQADIIKLELPSSTKDDLAWVKLNLNLDAGTIEDASNATTDPISLSVEIMHRVITEWNFTGDDGKVAEISRVNIRHLLVQDFKAIDRRLQQAMDDLHEVEALSSGEKKT